MTAKKAAKTGVKLRPNSDERRKSRHALPATELERSASEPPVEARSRRPKAAEPKGG